MDAGSPEKKRSEKDRAAESTQFRTQEGEPRARRLPGTDTAHLAQGQSIRLHSPRGGRSSLAARLSLPIMAGIVIALGAVCFAARTQARESVLRDLEADAANAAYMGGMFGRILIRQHDAFLRENPDYLRKEEFRAGDHWLVAKGFVSEGDWAEATGFAPDETAPAAAMYQATRRTALAELAKFINSPESGTELVALFVLDADDVVLASCRSESFQFDAAALRAVPHAGARHDVGNASVAVDHVEDFEPEPLVRATVRIFADDAEGGRLGSAIAVLRTDRRLGRLNRATLLTAGLSALLAAALAVVCRLSARRAAAPLKRLAADMRALADGDYGRRSAIRENDETGLAAQAFNSMAERLRAARLSEQETSRLESDLSIARGIQNNLLPQQTPRVRGFDIHTSYRPAKEIGGDYFDFLPVDGEHMGIVVADASGKSIPAALVMSTTRAILRFVAPGGGSAAETLTRVNAILSADIPRGMFVTAYYVILDPLENAMLCASAGHTPLLIARRDGTVELLNPGGIALGFDSGPIFQRSIREERVRLEPGDRALLYTDGVVECVNSADEEYSDRRLREFVRRNRDLSSHDFVGALMADLDRHRGTAEMRDDTTVVTFKML